MTYRYRIECSDYEGYQHWELEHPDKFDAKKLHEYVLAATKVVAKRRAEQWKKDRRKGWFVCVPCLFKASRDGDGKKRLDVVDVLVRRYGFVRVKEQAVVEYDSMAVVNPPKREYGGSFEVDHEPTRELVTVVREVLG